MNFETRSQYEPKMLCELHCGQLVSVNADYVTINARAFCFS